MIDRLGLGVCAAVATVVLCACSPSNDWYVQRILADQVAGTVHDCVPLGWNPERIDDNFFTVGYSAEVDETYWFVSPPWAAGFGPRDARDPRGKTTRELLAHLVQAGMVNEVSSYGTDQYKLAEPGFERFFDDDHFGNNRLHNPYVCYTTIVPRSIVWKQPEHLENDPYGKGRVHVFRVAFNWTVSPDTHWMPDAFIRAHTVVLGPARNPAIAKFVLRGSTWDLEDLYPSMPDNIVNPAAWP